MDIREAKQQFIDFIYSRPGYKRTVNRNLYLTRCPYCGDSRTDLNTGHLYILVSPEETSRMVFYCQRCQEHGVVGDELVTLLDGDESVRGAVGVINTKGTTSKKTSSKQFTYFDAILPDEVPPAYTKKIKYIENRLGISITNDLMKKLKIVVSPYDFLIANDIKKTMYKPKMMNILERDYVGFLSTGNSHILFRDIANTHSEPWLKYPITPESKSNHVSFSYDVGVDIFSKDEITVNFSEGVFDAIGVKEYFHKDNPNTVDIAVCGMNYYAMIKYLVHIGLVGSNVSLNMYLDNDKEFNNGKEWKIPRYMKDVTKALFNRVAVYRNLIGKDYGVKKEEILLDKKLL